MPVLRNSSEFQGGSMLPLEGTGESDGVGAWVVISGVIPSSSLEGEEISSFVPFGSSAHGLG